MKIVIQLTVLLKVLLTLKLHGLMMDIKGTCKIITLYDMIFYNQIIANLDLIDCYKNSGH